MQNLIKLFGFLSIKSIHVTFFLIFLAACGNKGPLTLPDIQSPETGMQQSSEINTEQ
tara:strand:- start:308 stop:478 length:171 start_codon:yes stop_codon:yes gene_type:complete